MTYIEAHCYAHQCRQIDVCNYVVVSINNWLQDVSATSAAYKNSCRNVQQSVVDWYCYVSAHNQFAYAYIILVTKERATCLCTNGRTVDSHCAVRPFRGMPPIVSSTGRTASRSCQAITNLWLASSKRLWCQNHRFIQKQRKSGSCRVKIYWEKVHIVC